MQALPGKVRRALEARCGVPPETPMVIGVSGGADSVALLLSLARQPRRFRARHVVAHLNHGLRGSAADEDEAFVRDLSTRLGFDFVCRQLGRHWHRGKRGESVEMACRRARHGFLASVAEERGLPLVCLAHHADDQIENFFMRLFRGAGGEGLLGIRWRVSSPANPSVSLVRPLLGCRHTELLEFLGAIGQAHREDETNRDHRIPRNRIRHELLPLLRGFAGPSLDDIILRTAETLGAEAEFVSGIARTWSIRPDQEFAALHVAIQRAVIRQQLIELGESPSFRMVEALRTTAGRAVSGPRGTHWRRSPEGHIRMIPREIRIPDGGSSDHLRIALVGHSGQFLLPDGATLAWRSVVRPKDWSPSAGGCECLDAERVGKELHARRWRPGDRYRSLGTKAASKLQNHFVNRHIPRIERDRRWLICTADLRIAWVEGLPPGDEFKVDRATRRILELRLVRPSLS